MFFHIGVGMSILEKYLKKNFPEDRMPTIEECVASIKNPESVPLWIKEYMRLRPQLEKHLRSILDLQ